MLNSKLSRWRLAMVVIALVIVTCVGIGFFLVKLLGLGVETGDYRVVDVSVGREGGNSQRPGEPPIFGPLDTVVCTVRTQGVDGIIGIRWIHDGDVLNETIGKTHDNTITAYMAGSPSNPIPEGDYRVEVFLVRDPVAVAYFRISAP